MPANIQAGQKVFRFETFGSEGFWADVMRLPEGMENEKFSPMQAWQAGLRVDVDALDEASVNRETRDWLDFEEGSYVE